MSKLSFRGHVKASPFIKPLLNLGCLFDIQTGHYVKGLHGENILNGGLAPLTGIGGLPNTYKSTLAHYMTLIALDRHSFAHGNVYDTEMSMQERRFENFAACMERLDPNTLMFHETANPDGRLMLTDATIATGDAWFDQIKAYGDVKVKNKDDKSVSGNTPFKDKDGKALRAMYPSVVEIDSLSRMPIAAVDAILDKNAVGESGNNVEALRSSHAKNQMLIQMPVLTTEAALYTVITAHVSKGIDLDPYKPDPRVLSHLKNGLKFKYVPDQYYFLMQNLWFCFAASPMRNQTTKAAEYPRSSEDDDKASCDLMSITVMNLRGKYGASGMPYEYIVSQSEGLLVGLTEFNYLKQYGRFGLGGNDRNYYLELCPDISLSRTTVRSKLREHAKLRRAMEITSEICQMKNLWYDMDRTLLCDPKDLFADLKAKGYDWDVLLNTRGYWVFENDKHPLPFLSTMDLLEMRAGTYKPYWMS